MGRYGVILDAGSSGTRVHIYRWPNIEKARQDNETLTQLPKLETKKKWTKKIKPGVSFWGSNAHDVGPEHLQGLLDHALSYIPKDQIHDTPLFLMATAGVRLLKPLQQSALLSEICAYAQMHTKFSLPNCDLHIQVIPGETEGLYGWIAANYLLGGFDEPHKHAHGKGHNTYGFLDMGGASAQIAFAPNATESDKHAKDLKLLRMRTLNGNTLEYKVFTTSWLGFGVNQARDRYVSALTEATLGEDSKELPDPCLHSGMRTTLNGEPIPNSFDTLSGPLLVGTGDFSQCVRQCFPLLDKYAPCLDQPCLLHGQHVPAIDFDVNHFVGVSEYWHTTHELFAISQKEKPYDFKTYQSMVSAFCSAEWSEVENRIKTGAWGEKVDLRTAQEACFKASWLINVLHDGIGIPRVGAEKHYSGLEYNGTREEVAASEGPGFLDPFQAVDKINGIEVSWTMGKMVLYAAGQIPPVKPESLPVGFGSNAAGIPPDFQDAGSNSMPVPIGDIDDFVEDAIDEVPAQVQTRSNIGLIIFIFVLIFTGNLLRKRERRMRLYRGFKNAFRRHRRQSSPRKGGRKWFSRYERLQVDSEAANDFELGEVDSDDNENSDSSEAAKLGRSSGLATPKLQLSNFESTRHLDVALGNGDGLGLQNGGLPGPNAMDRSGLVVRTESRERLSPGFQLHISGRRSRAGSPTRIKSPLPRTVDVSKFALY